MSKEYFLAYHSYLENWEDLSDVECGRLFRAALKYSIAGEAPSLTGCERYLFKTVKSQIDRDNKKYDEKCAKNKENGKYGALGGRPKKGENPKNPNGFPKTLNKGEGEDKGKCITPLSTNVDVPPFEKFWEAYPKKVAKQAAVKAFAKLSPSEATLNVILAGVRKWSETKQWLNDGGEFIPNPATFLNGARWEDEMPERSETNGADESEVGRRTRCTEFLDVKSQDGNELTAEEREQLRRECEELERIEQEKADKRNLGEL